MSIKIKVLLSCLPLMFILSCGGGGGGGGDDDPGLDPGDTLNPGLAGKFFFSRHGAYTMDVDTGEYRLVPNTSDWTRQRDRFPDGVALISASRIVNNNTEFLVIASSLESYMALQDYNGNYLGQTMHLSGDVRGGGAVSQDGQYIALFREVNSVTNNWLEIYNWNSGELVSDRYMDSRQIIWLRDNRLLYSGGRTLYFTKPASTEIDNSMTLPEPSGNLQAGLIGNFTVSPDETQIAFTVSGQGEDLVQDVKHSRLYMVNSDGTNLRLVATTPGDTGENSDDNSGPRVAAPEWSPDGRWIYVEEGFVDVGTIGGTEFYADMYVLPTEDMGKVFYLSTDDSKRSPEVRRFWRYNTLPGEGGGVTGKALPRNAFYWIPD